MADLTTVLHLVNQIGPAMNRGDREKLNDIIAQLIALQAPMGEQWQQLAYIALGNGEVTLARQAIDLFAAASGGHAGQLHKMNFLAVLGAWTEAEAVLRGLPETVPHPDANAYSRGTIALNLGRPDEARDHLARVTQAIPQSGQAWFSLSLATDFAREPQLAERLIGAEPGMAQTPLSERIPYYHALGKAHAEQGEHALAFDAFARGARLMKSTLRYSSAQDRAEAETSAEGYTPERIAAIGDRQTEATSRTIFIAGLPRSGTTLLEQILTGHSTVSDGGEIGRLALLSNEVGGASWSALSGYVDRHSVGKAARLWDHWLDELFPGAARIIDKTVTTSRFMGLAAALLPQAPLIWITRDPLDRAWSCFRTNFAGTAMPWSYDLEDIAEHFRIEDQLLARWQDILGERLLVLSYEALASDSETWIRHVLAHCGLAEEPQVFAPHENRRAVPTASMVQVRSPINRKALGAAEPYRDMLKPFIDAYYR